MDNTLLEELSRQPGVAADFMNQVRKSRMEAGEHITEMLVSRNLIDETRLLEFLAVRYRMPFWPDLSLRGIQGDFSDRLPIRFLKKHLMVPIRAVVPPAAAGKDRKFVPDASDATSSPGIIIAISSPAAFAALDDLVRLIDTRRFRVVFSTRNAIIEAISLMYELKRDTAEQLVQDMEATETMDIGDMENAADLMDDVNDAPIIKLVNNILSQSIKAGASDIHIEPYDDGVKVRHRVDGILYDLVSPPKWIQAALTSRIKIMAKLDIAEKRLPQDGRLEVTVTNQKIDIRVSTIPTSFGERVVLRLLNKTSSLLALTELGLSSEALDLVAKLIASPNGILLVTGPTGSGKTTTLYSVLATINKPDVNIITIEDPVEYQIQGISQIQVNPKIDLTFARGLRSIVRQDPDVILIGEIRDHETAEIAVQSALTGHLVFSTLHTNDSASAITRLVDIGVEPFLISSSILAIVAQRLVRVLCEHCKKPYAPSESILESLGLPRRRLKGSHIHKAVGCENCFQTGFKGRLGLFEVLRLDERLKGSILTAYDATRIKKEAQRLSMKTLRQDGVDKVIEGITTFEEVMRVAAL